MERDRDIGGLVTLATLVSADQTTNSTPAATPKNFPQTPGPCPVSATGVGLQSSRCGSTLGILGSPPHGREGPRHLGHPFPWGIPLDSRVPGETRVCRPETDGVRGREWGNEPRNWAGGCRRRGSTHTRGFEAPRGPGQGLTRSRGGWEAPRGPGKLSSAEFRRAPHPRPGQVAPQTAAPRPAEPQQVAAARAPGNPRPAPAHRRQRGSDAIPGARGT